MSRIISSRRDRPAFDPNYARCAKCGHRHQTGYGYVECRLCECKGAAPRGWDETATGAVDVPHDPRLCGQCAEAEYLS